MPAVPSLGALRRLWFLAAVAIVLLAAVAVATAEAASSVPAVLPALLVAAAGAGAVAGVVAVDRTFAAVPPDGDAAAIEELRTRAYLQLAIAEAPVLLGFAVAYVLGPGWVSALGGVAGLTALAVARPTPGRLRRLEAAWAARGAEVSLQRPCAADPVPPSAAPSDADDT